MNRLRFFLMLITLFWGMSSMATRPSQTPEDQDAIRRFHVLEQEARQKFHVHKAQEQAAYDRQMRLHAEAEATHQGNGSAASSSPPRRPEILDYNFSAQGHRVPFCLYISNSQHPPFEKFRGKSVEPLGAPINVINHTIPHEQRAQELGKLAHLEIRPDTTIKTQILKRLNEVFIGNIATLVDIPEEELEITLANVSFRTMKGATDTRQTPQLLNKILWELEDTGHLHAGNFPYLFISITIARKPKGE